MVLRLNMRVVGFIDTPLETAANTKTVVVIIELACCIDFACL